jgi:transposase
MGVAAPIFRYHRVMRYHQSTTSFNCGIDLHARSMYVCVVDRQGNVVLHQNIKNNDFAFFLKKIQPFRHDLTITCECMFAWYWLADACARENLLFVLAHALYLRAIHGGKNKNDRIDSEKLARLLAAHLIPVAYVYPADKRPVRALLRQRLTYVWRRSELLMRVHSMQQAEGHEPVPRGARNRDPWEARLIERYPNAHHQVALKTDLATIRHYDRMILDLEGQLVRTTRRIASRDYALLKTVPGIGQSLALTILYEVDDIHRFETVQRFSSYCRLVKGTVASGGKIKGLRGAKLGNPYLRWAIGEAAVLGRRHQPRLAAWHERLCAQKGAHKANAIVANQLGRALYYMLKNGTGFDVEQLVGGQ